MTGGTRTTAENRAHRALEVVAYFVFAIGMVGSIVWALVAWDPTAPPGAKFPDGLGWAVVSSWSVFGLVLWSFSRWDFSRSLRSAKFWVLYVPLLMLHVAICWKFVVPIQHVSFVRGLVVATLEAAVVSLIIGLAVGRIRLARGRGDSPSA